MSGARLAAAAETLVGSPFRLHGRDPAHGLDCIGVLSAALAALDRSDPLPTGYRLRLSGLAAWLPDPAAIGFAPTVAALAPGDVTLLRLGPAQFHLVIAARDAAHIHAHAGLRRVVRSPGLPDGVPLHRWRLIDKDD